MRDRVLHRWLRLPYKLHVHIDKGPRSSRQTVVFIHGLGNTSESWDKVIDKLPSDIRIICVDLLGFGKSPMPSWTAYNVKVQAHSIAATLLSLRIRGRVVLVGHSLGSLVAIEVAKRYPVAINSLLLCSPPFYDKNSDGNHLVRAAFSRAKRDPKPFLKLAGFAMRHNLVNKSFNLTEDNIKPYLATLGASILSQNSLEDAKGLKAPIYMLLGTIDPWVKKQNLKAVMRENPNAKLRVFIGGHEIRGTYTGQVVRAIEGMIRP